MKYWILALSVFTIVGCASHDTKTVLLNKPDTYASAKTYEHFTIGAELYDNDGKTQAAFDQKLVSKGIYPVQIAVENTSDEMLLIVRDSIELDSSVSTAIRPMNAQEVAEEVEANAIAHAVFGFGIFSYGAAKDANDEREADYANKQLAQELLIRPGRLAGGFVFFRAEKGENLRGRRLMIPVQYASGKTEEVMAEIQF